MAKKYRSVQQYSKKIYELHNQGLTHREVGEKIGLSYKQVKKFFEREHRKERALAAGKALHKRGRTKNQNSEIPPILRSVWFLPHVLLFVISYAILICAWISSGIMPAFFIASNDIRVYT